MAPMNDELVDLVIEARDNGRDLSRAQLTRIAQALATGHQSESLGDACQGCGEPISQPRGRGRPRRWCGKGRCAKNAKNR